jgi:hypothetical protein
MIERTAEGDGSERTLKLVRWQQASAEAMRFAELAVSTCDRPCREAIILAASELAENLVKYGVPSQDPRASTITVGVHGNVARIRATNAVSSPADARSVIDIVARISAPSSNPKELYRERLQELFSTPGAPRAQLGLLRLAFEGGFRLSASFQMPILEITAERPCNGEPSR